MTRYVMEFEREFVELEKKLADLRRMDLESHPDLFVEVSALAEELERLRIVTYSHLTPWARVQIARHPGRPKTQDYVEALFTDVVELFGDRLFADDAAIFTGFATFEGRRCVVLGHRKGKNTKENIERNFGSPLPEGYRKAMRVMRLAAKANLPVITFLDTAGAYPSLEAEERGQAWAIAESLELLAGLPVPVVVVGIGEGGSGGALAIGFGDHLIMLENAYYSVSSPEACSSIVWKDAAHAADAAAALKMSAQDLVELGIADEIVPEPLSGAHADPGAMFDTLRPSIAAALDRLVGTPAQELVDRRYARLRAIGAYSDGGDAA